ncbi:Holliday junction branch migration protein RuvA [Geopsychrobacter electrodiphilus]|uniref:Holliday junction branch migration protein RuvA n=1 Tax=Geopsychrobacter electrodiphilus TaxID=225196 RepID=UPI00036BEDBB|nr:Holliday junction branch migration protein RuvA [Geopsychrobacter electrodiphilus]
MIALLTGEITQRRADAIVIDVAGVGYRVQVPLSTFYGLPETGKVCLHIYTHVKEDAISLFGFLSAEEKDFFALLISVSGVGPKLAINILSHMPAGELAAALIEDDIARLTSIPGIGKKSAERLVLELREKAKNFIRGNTGTINLAKKPIPSGVREDAISALINLGYKDNLANKAVNSLKFASDTALEEILKNALQMLRK